MGLLSHDPQPEPAVSPELSKRLRALRQEIEEGARERDRKRAYQLILRRKHARQELGNAKRAIRTLGRAALNAQKVKQ